MRTRLALPFPLALLHADWKDWQLNPDGSLTGGPRDDARPVYVHDIRYIWLFRGGLEAIERERRRVSGPLQYLIDLK